MLIQGDVVSQDLFVLLLFCPPGCRRQNLVQVFGKAMHENRGLQGTAVAPCPQHPSPLARAGSSGLPPKTSVNQCLHPSC